MRKAEASSVILGAAMALSVGRGGVALADSQVGEDDVEENQVAAEANEIPANGGRVKVLPCRPTIACTAELVPANTWEVEAGYSDRRSSGTTAHGGQLLIKYSVLDRLQLQLATNNVFSAPVGGSVSYFDGGVAGLKARFTPQGRFLPMISASLLVSFPTQSGQMVAQRSYDTLLWVYFSKDIGFVHTDLNFGWDTLDLSGSAKPQEVVAWSASTDLAYGFGFMTEGYGFFGGSAAVADAGWLNAISYAPIPEVMFDLGGDAGLVGVDRTYTLFVGVTFIPPHIRSRGLPAYFAAPKAAPDRVVAQQPMPRPILAAVHH